MTISLNSRVKPAPNVNLTETAATENTWAAKVVKHNRKQKIERENRVREQYNIVCFGHEYDSLGAILALYSVLTKKTSLNKLSLLSAAQELGIELLGKLAEAGLNPLRENVYFDVISFENWLEIDGIKISSLPAKYVPYMAVGKHNQLGKNFTSPPDEIGLIKVA